MSKTIVMLECKKWTKVSPEFSDLVEAVELLESMGLRVCRTMVDPELYGGTRYSTITPTELEHKFMVHKGIDKQALMKERQALLEQVQEDAKNQQSLEMGQ